MSAAPPTENQRSSGPPAADRHRGTRRRRGAPHAVCAVCGGAISGSEPWIEIEGAYAHSACQVPPGPEYEDEEDGPIE